MKLAFEKRCVTAPAVGDDDDDDDDAGGDGYVGDTLWFCEFSTTTNDDGHATPTLLDHGDAAEDHPDCTHSTPRYHEPRHHRRRVTALVSTFTLAVQDSDKDPDAFELELNHTHAGAISVLEPAANDTHEPDDPSMRQLPPSALTFTADWPQPSVSVDTDPIETPPTVSSVHNSVDGRTTPDTFDTEPTDTDQRLTVETTDTMLLLLVLFRPMLLLLVLFRPMLLLLVLFRTMLLLLTLNADAFTPTTTMPGTAVELSC